MIALALRRLSRTTAVLLVFTVSASQANDGYGSISDTEFERVLTAYEADPTYLARNTNTLRRLTSEQISEAIERLGFTHFSYQTPIIIKGDELGPALGEPIETLSVMVVRGNEIRPIPYQIDEIDTEGWVYFPQKSPNELAGRWGVLDENDELVFMYRDTGDRYDPSRHDDIDASIIREIQLHHNGRDRYAYLVKGSSRRDESQYASFNMETGQFRSTYWDFRVDPESFLNFHEMYAHVGPAQDHMVFHSVNGNISTGIVSPWPRLNFTLQDNIEIQPVAVKDGPVRAPFLAKAWVVVAGVRIFYIHAQITLYDQRISIPLKIQIPGGEILTRLLQDPVIQISLNFNDLKDARVNAAISDDPQGYALVDGRMSEFEKRADISHEHNWLWMDSRRGWDIFVNFDLPPDWPEDLSLFYLDCEGCDDVPGVGPRVGFVAKGFPVGKLDIELALDIWLVDTVGKHGPQRFAGEVAGPPTASTVAFEPAPGVMPSPMATR